jgi:hypothetical protein
VRPDQVEEQGLDRRQHRSSGGQIGTPWIRGEALARGLLLSARLYHLNLRTEYRPLTMDTFAQIKEECRLAGRLDELRDNAAYGFIAKRSA